MNNTKEPILKLESMHAHSGECVVCQNGIVKMMRDAGTFRLRPDWVSCLNCGQRYFMEIHDLDAWELQQWQQKEKELP